MKGEKVDGLVSGRTHGRWGRDQCKWYPQVEVCRVEVSKLLSLIRGLERWTNEHDSFAEVGEGRVYVVLY